MKTFEEYYNQYLPAMKKLAYTHRVNGYDIDDVVQELSMILNKAMKSYKPRKGVKFFTYFMTSCYNWLARIRNKQYNYEALLTIDINHIVDESSDTYEKLYEEQLRDNLKNVKYGDLIKMHYLYGVKMKTIAEMEGISPSAVTQNINKGLEELRKIYKKLA